LFKFLSLFGECVCIHCFECSLVPTVINETQVSLPATMCLRNHCHLSSITVKMSKLKPFSEFCVHQWAFSEAILHKTCDGPV
jgi:hypothetical protein